MYQQITSFMSAETRSRTTRWSTRAVRALVPCALALAGVGCATAQTTTAQTGTAQTTTAQTPSPADWVEHRLTVRYGDYVFNGQAVKLRTYNGKLVGPEIRVKPGDVLRVVLRNELKGEEPAPCKSSHSSGLKPPPPQGPPPEPCGFNITNLHTHGLHVSPSGNSDNVLIAVKPGEEFVYEYIIPRDHPSGTFWYHAHVHGSTSIQLASGMAGPLIVENNAMDQRVLGAYKERILLFQQIPYLCGDGNNRDKWQCQRGQVGVVERFDLFGPTAWKDSGRPTSINGTVHPVYELRPKEIQRWRLIHGGIRETINVGINRVPVPLKDCGRTPSSPIGLKLRLSELARDGITMTELRRGEAVRLQPGYRSDILLQIADKGCYALIDRATSAAESLQAIAEEDRILGYLKVDGEDKPQTMPAPAAIRAIARPTDHPVPGPVKQKVDFSIELADPNNKCGRGRRLKPRFVVNGRYFEHDAKPRVLPLGATETWQITSSRANHPFHIHVNHFLVDIDEVTGERFRYWKDTAMVTGPPGSNECKPERGPILTLTTTYTQYIGQFVLHCHILDHEDQGMMELVEIRASEAHPGAHGHADPGDQDAHGSRDDGAAPGADHPDH